MKLKNLLVLAFLVLTFIPTTISLILLYKSGFDLSKESYTRNLEESITVQADYISQTIENNMISDSRFAKKVLYNKIEGNKLFSVFESYLEAAEDKITVTVLLDSNDSLLYTVGEKKVLDLIMSQLPVLSDLEKQTIMEFTLEDNTYSLGIITPVYDSTGIYQGSLISIYDKSYIFKTISSYYEIADTSTYICRNSGEVISSRGPSSDDQNLSIEAALNQMSFNSQDTINLQVGGMPVTGYYKNIYNSSWYLVGLLDNNLLYSFTNQFVLIYMILIAAVLFAGVLLAYLFSRKVVQPINHLIQFMDSYQNNMPETEMPVSGKREYYETRYLRTRFFELMKRISLIQHNFQGIYQLYQSNDMGDTNIELDAMKQVAHSNKPAFQELMDSLVLPPEACIVERFTNCFCEKDQKMLMEMFIGMRDEHLSVTSEAEIYTPYLGCKWFHSLVVPMYDRERLSSLFIQLRDITSFKKQELESSEQARRDSLTGLYNRSGFIESVARILQNSTSVTELHRLLFIDMNYFKLVNDNLGHSEGDALLRTIGSTILASVRPQDIASRFGGDEFAIFLPYCAQETMEALKSALSAKLIYAYRTENIEFVVSASIGASAWDPAAQNTLEQMLQTADESMYQAKRDFKSKVEKK